VTLQVLLALGEIERRRLYAAWSDPLKLDK
jgi:hypothetical protein